MSERLREIKSDRTKGGVPVTFQIWDVTRLKRIHDARSVRDDLFVDLSHLPGGGLPALPAAVGSDDYDAYLVVIPGEVLADVYIEHGSRLLEGNVRTFLGRTRKINRGIAATLANEPGRFFAYNNGIAATASEVRKVAGPAGTALLTGLVDLQVVNGGQTTASRAALRREGKLPVGSVSVPMKLSVVAPDAAEVLIPRISRFANTQNGARCSATPSSPPRCSTASSTTPSSCASRAPAIASAAMPICCRTPPRTVSHTPPTHRHADVDDHPNRARPSSTARRRHQPNWGIFSQHF